MEELILTTEQQQDFGKSLLQRIKEYFKEIFHSDKRKEGKDLEEVLLSMTQSEEERETLQEIFDEIDLTYQKRKEFIESHKNPDQWTERDLAQWQEKEIENIVKKVDPNATRDDIDKVMAAIASGIDVDILRSSKAVEELSDSVNDTKVEETEV